MCEGGDYIIAYRHYGWMHLRMCDGKPWFHKGTVEKINVSSKAFVNYLKAAQCQKCQLRWKKSMKAWSKAGGKRKRRWWKSGDRRTDIARDAARGMTKARLESDTQRSEEQWEGNLILVGFFWTPNIYWLKHQDDCHSRGVYLTEFTLEFMSQC